MSASPPGSPPEDQKPWTSPPAAGQGRRPVISGSSRMATSESSRSTTRS